MRHTSFYFALIHCASQTLCLFVCLFVFLQIEGLWHVSVTSISDIFPTAFAHFVSLCYLLVILAIYQTFALFL